ncbi:hypothetical protein P4O66_003091 [Electrophorus voltai]|uniref:Uncharacterized protein n=1 Tax=Electrophorus voltai TaxID=2609070 RepID=A0AAD8YSX5_9TELE|nr:hypothetical protein P4O66_003091 [Electrophorus voltai]
MGSRLSRQNSLDSDSFSRRRRQHLDSTGESERSGRSGDLFPSLVLKADRLPCVLRRTTHSPYVRRVAWIRQIQKLLREKKTEEATDVLKLLRKVFVCIFSLQNHEALTTGSPLVTGLVMSTGTSVSSRIPDFLLCQLVFPSFRHPNAALVWSRVQHNTDRVRYTTLLSDLGLEGSSLNDILYKNAAFLNLVDPISHELLLVLARDMQCPKKKSDCMELFWFSVLQGILALWVSDCVPSAFNFSSTLKYSPAHCAPGPVGQRCATFALFKLDSDTLKSSDKICRQLIYHLTPHSKWLRQRRKTQS